MEVTIDILKPLNLPSYDQRGILKLFYGLRNACYSF